VTAPRRSGVGSAPDGTEAEAPTHTAKGSPRAGSAAAAVLRVRALARKEMRQLLRDPRSRVLMFVSPIVQLLLFGYAVNTDVRRAATYVVDLDRSPASRHLVDALTAGESFRVVGGSLRPADLGAALDHGVAVVGLQIPAGFARDLAAGRPAPLQVIIDGSNSNTATIVQANAMRFAQRFSRDMLAERLGGSAPAPPIDVRARAWFNPSLSSRVYNVPAVIGAILMLMCLLLTSLAVVREREVGTLEQLLVSPVTTPQLVIGKTLPVLLVALVDLVLITTVARLWFDVPFRGSYLVLLAAALLFVLGGLSIGLLISSISRTQQEAFMALFLVLLPAIILSGFLLPVAGMPPFFQVLTQINPLRHFLDIVRAVFLKGAGFTILAREFAALATVSTAILLAAAWRMSRLVREAAG
jgi:ABC-2 type transport system permease protein